MLGEGIVSLGVALVTDRRNVKSSAKMHFSSFSLPVTRMAAGRELDVALFVVELHLEVVVRFGDPANLINEVHVPGRAAVLAVSHPLEPDILLHPDDGSDGGVLDPALVLGRDAALRVVIPRLEDVGRAKQAADVVGSKRRNSVHAEMPRSERIQLRFNHN